MDKNRDVSVLKHAQDSIDKKNSVLIDGAFQQKLIKLLIEDNLFSEQIVDLLKVEYFDSILTKMLINYVLIYVEKYNIVPDWDSLSDLIKDREKDEIQAKYIIDLIEELKGHKLTDKQHIKDVSLEFCLKQSLKKGIVDAIDAWDKGNYESVSKIINDSIKVNNTKDRGHDFFKDVESRLQKQFRNPISCLKGLDPKIGGGLSGGELGIVMAPTGGGKSMMLVRFACTALESGKNVLYYTMELSEKVVANRFDACLTEVPLAELYQFADAIKDKLEDVKGKGGSIFIKEFPTGSASILNIKNHLRLLQRYDFTPDVIFIDYADLMRPTGTHNEKRFALTNIYESIRGLSMEMNIPIWTASQGNRSSYDKEHYGLEAIGESLGKAQTADVILGISRISEQRSDKKAKLLMLKNRNGEDGFNMNLYFDTSKVDIRVIQDHFDSQMGLKGLELEKRILSGI